MYRSPLFIYFFLYKALQMTYRVQSPSWCSHCLATACDTVIGAPPPHVCWPARTAASTSLTGTQEDNTKLPGFPAKNLSLKLVNSNRKQQQQQQLQQWNKSLTWHRFLPAEASVLHWRVQTSKTITAAAMPSQVRAPPPSWLAGN